MMRFKNMLKHFSKTEVQEDKTHPCHLSQTILNRLFGRVLEREGVSISCAKHTVKHLFSYSPIHLFTFKKVAFTLAEVLITLGIIGVVAALTLPTLISNHQKQTYVTGLKKAYANIQNALAKMAYDEGVTEWKQTSCFSDNWNSVRSEDCFNRIKKQFNVVKSEHFDYWQNWADFSGICGYIYTNDGMIYLIDCFGSIDVDVNGDRGPNKWGRDRFTFSIDPTKNKVVPDGINDYQTYCTTANVSTQWGVRACTAKVLIEGKMDY